MSEFDGIAFALGSVRGTRAFDVDKLGRLIGVHYRQIWTPGENQAVCLRNQPSRQRTMSFRSLMAGFDSDFNGIKYRAIDKTIEEAQLEAHRKVAEEERIARDSLVDCGHGFYGFYEGSNDYRDKDRVNGVIEGYGEVVIGTRGFRAMKARILALHIPKHLSENAKKLVLRNYPDVPVFDKFKQMVAEFPADDAGLGSTPENDPEFWSRPV